jgi:hypothetical protein
MHGTIEIKGVNNNSKYVIEIQYKEGTTEKEITEKQKYICLCLEDIVSDSIECGIFLSEKRIRKDVVRLLNYVNSIMESYELIPVEE